MGALVALLGIWGALVPFFGPSISFGSGSSWQWTESHTTLHLVPGIAALIAGAALAGRGRGLLARAAAVLAVAAGVWFVIGPSLHPIWAGTSSATHSGSMSGGHMAGTMSSRMGTSSAASSMGMGMTAAPGSGSTTHQALEALGYHYGTGALIAVLASVALGLLASAPMTARVRAPAPTEARRSRPRMSIRRPAQS